MLHPPNNAHLILQPANFQSWSIAINNGIGDIDTCPPEIARTLRPAKHNVKNPFKELEGPKSSPHTPIPAGPGAPYFPFYPPPYGYYPPPPQSYDHRYRYQMKNGPSSPLEMLRSSPIPTPEEDVDKLTLYFTWLCTLYPSKKDKLEQCHKALEGEDIVFRNLRNISDALFDRWEISEGIRLIVKEHCKKFEKAAQAGQV